MPNTDKGVRHIAFTATAAMPFDSSRPTWQNKILILNPGERTKSGESIAISLKSFYNLTLAAASPPPHASLLATASDDVLRVLFSLVEIFGIHGSTSVLNYYSKSSKEVEKIDDYLYAVCSQILAQEVPSGPPSPEYIVPQILAFIVIGSRLTDPKCRMSFSSTRFIKKADYLIPHREQPSVFAACDRFLAEKKFSANYTTELLVCGMVLGLWASIMLQENSEKISLDMTQHLLTYTKGRVENLFVIANPPYRILFNIAPTDYQIGKLNQKYRRMHVSFKQDWWEVSDLYLKALKKIIRCGKEEAVVDFFSLAVVQRMLLHALLTGVARNVSYKDIERVTREMESSAAAIAAWAPPVWLLEVETEVKIVKEDVLPFLLKINPSPNHLIDTLSTPGFLDLFTTEVVTSRLDAEPKIDRVCAFCGAEGDGLRRCGGVSSKKYFFSFKS
jgi:hypothetical protein